ncbi:HAD-superfamily hydrolase, subfamily IA, variant 1 [Beutenbergia cavernae DSM 12333]|uniref:HAD-superfamily hydrolase, subfamily IA, variant 1 n=1 Tax=Beutenbergia cavernae (strain ATCC BAA-8 / DSM 12333 / CCUG 43141 / JCM 11478 / NBRC 16432 / NCIMB 13614 / HKI 0122) TaxID=471853 RepID=C5BZH8_BEUC1|nr:HAD family hydrolase [Beutenbergia cavernae]ACQ79150.1 HAD-superfamily hydrolase, subfamily IA, variant 1 [Beutenbergia cavernae DSM 12333]
MPTTSPCLLIDLDDTLVERTAAFTRWARDVVGEVDGSPADLAWLVEADASGYTPRADLAGRMRDRFALEEPVDALVDRLLYEHVRYVTPADGVVARLDALRSAGWRVVVVTNGTERQQAMKLDGTGLGELVDGVVVSEAVGVAKPDARIFTRALEVAGAATEGGWMVGDHPRADVEGGRAAGLLTGWVSRGREWVGGSEPTVTARTTALVLDAVADAVAAA